jgi:hypothetical protein
MPKATTAVTAAILGRLLASIMGTPVDARHYAQIRLRRAGIAAAARGR